MAWQGPGYAAGQPTTESATRYLSFAVDRSAVPSWVTFRELTFKVLVGDAESVVVTGDGQPVAADYDTATKKVTFTTAAAGIELMLVNSTSDPAAIGNVEVSTLRGDKRWAFSLTFDDGYVETYTNGRAYLERYGYKGGVPLVGRFLDNPTPGGAYSYMNDAQVQEMFNAGWGIFNHGYSHQYASYFPNSTAVLNDVKAGQNRISAALPGFTSTVFTTPYVDGAYYPIIYNNTDYLGLRLYQGSGSQIRPVDYVAFGTNGFMTTGRNGIRHVDPDFDTVHSLAMAYPDNHYWLSLHTHIVDPSCDPVETSVDYLYNTYGAGGTNEVWVAPADRIHQYLLNQQLAVVPERAPASAALPPSVGSASGCGSRSAAGQCACPGCTHACDGGDPAARRRQLQWGRGCLHRGRPPHDQLRDVPVPDPLHPWLRGEPLSGAL